MKAKKLIFEDHDRSKLVSFGLILTVQPIKIAIIQQKFTSKIVKYTLVAFYSKINSVLVQKCSSQKQSLVRSFRMSGIHKTTDGLWTRPHLIPEIRLKSRNQIMLPF